MARQEIEVEDGGHLAFLFETEFLSVALVVLELTL